jgi:hypothetical protein
MYYKVLNSNNKVVDVLGHLTFARYTETGRLILCLEEYAQVIISSNNNDVWHVRGLYAAPGRDLE